MVSATNTSLAPIINKGTEPTSTHCGIIKTHVLRVLRTLDELKNRNDWNSHNILTAKFLHVVVVVVVVFLVNKQLISVAESYNWI